MWSAKSASNSTAESSFAVMTNIHNKMATGAAWMVMFKAFERSIGLISTVILARLLVPADFGLIMMAMSIIAALELLGAFSFDVALIQNRDASREHYDTAWTCNVLFGLSCFAMLLALAAPAAHFYDEPRLLPLIATLGGGNLIGGFENIGIVAFRKNLQFQQEFKFLAAKKVISFTVTVTAAYLLRNYWALVAGMLTGRIVGVIISYVMQAYRPRFCLQKFNELFSFSKWLLANNFIFFLVHRSADFVIGRMLGAKSLGLHGIAYEISNLPTTEMVAPINRAVFPGYAKIASDQAALRDSYLKVTSAIAMFAVPAATGIAGVAKAAVFLLLGDKWLDAVVLVQVLAFYGAIGALQTNTGPVYIAIGKPRILTVTSLIYVCTLLPLLLVGINLYSLPGVAWAFLIVALLNMPINLAFLMRELNISLGLLLAGVWRPILGAAVMYGVVSQISYLFGSITDSHQAALQLSVLVLSGCLTFVALVLASWHLAGRPEGAEQWVLSNVQQRLARWGA